MTRERCSLYITTLGRFAITREEQPLQGGNWQRRKVSELFKILLSAEQHRLHREQIQELLWPDSSPRQAASSLGKTLYLLRRALEPRLESGSSSAYILLEQDILSLIPASLEIDADLFEKQARAIQKRLQANGEGEEELEKIDAILALYSGDYLPDDLYEDWSQRRRDRLRRIYSWLLEEAAKRAIGSSQGQRAIEYLHSLLEQNPSDEAMHRELMRIYARMGRRSEALNQYHHLRETLQKELQTRPLAETQELYRAIQAGQIATDLIEEGTKAGLHSHRHAVRDSHGPERGEAKREREESNQTRVAGSMARQTAVREPIGRARELQRLQGAYLSGEEGEPRLFCISGEAGIGKTHLARAFSAWAEEQQIPVLQGACHELYDSLPYQPIIDMLSNHIHQNNAQQLQADLGEHATDLAKLLPELHHKLPNLPKPEEQGTEVERRNLYHAVASYLQSIAQKRRLILILDDLQWSDTATIQLLSYIFRPGATHISGTDKQPFLLLCYRADEVHEQHPLRLLLGTYIRTGEASELRLKRLSEEEVQRLLAQMGGHEVDLAFSKEIYRQTEGNPFFIEEAIRTLIEERKIERTGERWQSHTAPKDLALPPRVRMLIERRLVRLTPACKITLAHAALLGRHFHSEILCQVRNLSEEEIAEHIDEAIESNILQMQAEDTGPQESDLHFTHDNLREVLALWLNPLRRRTAHRHIARTLETYHAANLSPYYGKLAHHYLLAEERDKAIGYLEKAAEQAIGVYAFVEAASFLEKAIELLSEEDQRTRRAEILRKLSVSTYLYTDQPEKALQAALEASQIWQELNNPLKEAESRLDVAFLYQWTARQGEAIKHIQRALSCLESQPQEKRLLARAHAQRGLSAVLRGEARKALAEIERADRLHSSIGRHDPLIAVVTLWTKSWCTLLTGSLEEMLAYAWQSAELCRKSGRYSWEPMMLSPAAWALMLMGRLAEAEQTAREMLSKAQRQNTVGAQGWANLVLSFVAIQQGNRKTAEQYARAASTLASAIHDTDMQARVCWARSVRAGRENEWTEAIEHSLEGLQIIEQAGEGSLSQGYLLLQAAKSYFYAGQMEKAWDYLERSRSIAQEQQYQQLPALILRLQGRILQRQGRDTEAQTCFEESLQRLAELKDQVEYARTQEAYESYRQARSRRESKQVEKISGPGE